MHHGMVRDANDITLPEIDHIVRSIRRHGLDISQSKRPSVQDPVRLKAGSIDRLTIEATIFTFTRVRLVEVV
jgi:hypothetical protein